MDPLNPDNYPFLETFLIIEINLARQASESSNLVAWFAAQATSNIGQEHAVKFFSTFIRLNTELSLFLFQSAAMMRGTSRKREEPMKLKEIKKQ